MKPFGALDRYVLRQWLTTFVLSAIGVPAVAVLIDLSERFGKMSDRTGVSMSDIFLGQLLLFPGKIAILFPAGALFATVFTLNAMGRHSELTAVKAGGVSFYRLIAPMLLMAALCVPANFYLQELAAPATTRQCQLQQEPRCRGLTGMRQDVIYASSSGWTWSIGTAQRRPGIRLRQLLVERAGSGARTEWTVGADSARWLAKSRQWLLFNGVVHHLDDSGQVNSWTFRTMRAKAFNDPPESMLEEQKKAEEMTIGELRTYLASLRRSGVVRGMMVVELPLKYAVPVACFIVALFGAPLAVTNPRAGAALGLAIALGSTLVYLTGTQIMKAVGAKEVLSPIAAAWSMNCLFLLVAVVLLVRVRS